MKERRLLLQTGIIFAALLAFCTGDCGAVDWPLRINASGKYLIDKSGAPFPIIGDTAWSLAGQLGPTDVITYLNDRQAKGFNTIEVNAIEHYFATNAPNNYNNDPPFTNGPSDWSVMNEAYWSHVDFILNESKNRGILVLLYPAYLGFGCGSEGWCAQMLLQSDNAMTNYGRWLGDRYTNQGNIIWVHGGDANAKAYTNAYSRVAAITSGIKSADPASLHSASSSRGRSGMDDYNELLQINSIYSSGYVDVETQREYERSGAKPVYFYEGLYEGEGADALANESQALIPYLGGTIGALFGNCPVWHFGGAPGWCGSNDWKANLNSSGSVSMSNIGKLIKSRRWYNFIPDYDDTVVTSPKNTGITYNATTREKTGESVLVWCPTTSQITVNMTKISGAEANAWWWDPEDNSSAFIGSYPTTGAMVFTPGSERKVLVLDDVSKGYLAPGTGEAPPPPPPSLLVTEGTIGTEVTITGSGFGEKHGKVFVGDVKAKLAKEGWTDESITFIVNKIPEGSPDLFTITVETKSEEAGRFTFTDAFNIKSSEVDSYSNDNGAPGDEVSIVGKFFGTKKGKVYIAQPSGGETKPKKCKIVMWTMAPVSGTSEIKFLVPKLDPGSYSLRMTNKVGSIEVGGFTVK